MRCNSLIRFFILLILCDSCKEQAKKQVTTTPATATTELFTPTAIGSKFSTPPQIANLSANDIDNDGLLDVVACDLKNNTVSVLKQSQDGTFTETVVAKDLNAPAHVQVFDFDNDGDKDLIVAVLGMFFPNNDRIGSIVVLENQGGNNFKKHTIAEQIARVADVRAGDLDDDGDIDFAAAQFGYDDGETSWLENLGDWKFKIHSLQNLSGAINVVLVDIDQDNDLDIVSLVTQEWEKIYCFLNDGKGNFSEKQLWGSSNQDFGSSGISISDLNKDGKPDILYTNGDAFDYLPPLPRPWHGVQWLENLGDLNFKYHRICTLPGAFSARSADIDFDDDVDIFAVSGFNTWDKPNAESLVWLENQGDNTFKKNVLADFPTHLIALELGDFNNDKHMDLVTAGIYVYPPFENAQRITLWLHKGD